MSQDLRRIIEALLFVAEAPLNLNQLCHVLEASDRGKVREALGELHDEYQQMQRAFELVEVAGGWSFRTRTEHAHWLRKLRRQQVTRLSRAALETLAIVAYRQPVLKAEIERIRGVEVGGILRMLLEKGLLRVAGRKDLPGRPLVYGTTGKFLEVFDLKDLGELPTVEELESLSDGEALEADIAPRLPLGPAASPAEEGSAPSEAGEAELQTDAGQETGEVDYLPSPPPAGNLVETETVQENQAPAEPSLEDDPAPDSQVEPETARENPAQFEEEPEPDPEPGPQRS